MPNRPALSNEGYEIAWKSGTSLRVPRGFCVEEVSLLVELLRDAETER